MRQLWAPRASAPTIHSPASFSSLRVRTRLVTVTTGVRLGGPGRHLAHRGRQLRRAVLAARSRPARRRHRRCAGRRRGCADPARRPAPAPAAPSAPASAPSRSSSVQLGQWRDLGDDALVRHFAQSASAARAASTRLHANAAGSRASASMARMRGSSRRSAQTHTRSTRSGWRSSRRAHGVQRRRSSSGPCHARQLPRQDSADQLQIDQPSIGFTAVTMTRTSRTRCAGAGRCAARASRGRPPPSRIHRRAGCRCAAGRRPPRPGSARSSRTRPPS